MRNLLYFFLRRKVYDEVLKRGALYRVLVDRSDIEQYQLEQFNQVWRDAFTELPFYRQWKTKHGLPDRIESLECLKSWPIVTKKELQVNSGLLFRPGIKPDSYMLTGGSTGQPIRFGAWQSDTIAACIWLGQACHGIYPRMRTFHLWGHAHLFGKGMKRQFLILERSIKDRLSNRMRHPAYDLSIEAMCQAFNECQKWQPEVFSGYSTAVLAFCRINRSKNNFLKKSPVMVMSTAGPLSESEQKEIENYFQAPICMEYGSGDCSLMAYTIPKSKSYRVFWDTHLLQGEREENGKIRNIVTRLVHCYFPLIRYDIGDYLELSEGERLSSILNIRGIIGRPSENVRLDNGTSFFFAVIQDCCKQISDIIAVQLQLLPGKMNIKVVAIERLSDQDKELIIKRLHAVVPGLEKYPVTICQVEELTRTPAGKILLIVNETEASPNNIF